jgi:HD-GYP domain-containing protein (c-di-GMP phosphodiesterase class II)
VTRSRRTDGVDEAQSAQPAVDDPGLAALRQAELHYREARRALEREHAELARLRADNERLSSQLTAQHGELEQVSLRAEHQRQRAEALSDALTEIHHAVFGRNIYDLILKTCLTLTGATRGQYLTPTGSDAAVRPRATLDIDTDAEPQLSKFVTDLCREVLETEQVLVRNNLASALGQPERGHVFRNCIAAPVVLRANLSGVIVVADKASGDFDQQDADVLLSVGSQAAVAVENVRLQREVQQAYLSIVGLLAAAMAARDPQVQTHQLTSTRRARALAERLGLTDYEQSTVYYATLLHDVGNIGIGDAVLKRPGPLVEAERELIRGHVQIGHDLLQQVPLLHGVAEVVRHHHECYDGSGYPDGLQGDAIPITARVVAVVDAYAAMLSPRSYRPALSAEKACLELRRGAGTQFDPRVVDAFFLAGLDAPELLPSEEAEWHGLTLPDLDPRHGGRPNVITR